MRAFCICFCAGLAFCSEQNRILVHANPIGDHTNPDVGDNVDIEHLPVDGYVAQKPGFYAVHDTHDWLFVWKDPRPDAQPPPPPRGFDYEKQMLFVATAPDGGAKAITIKKVIGQSSGLHIYVTETLAGSSCPTNNLAAVPMDVITMPSIAYDIHVHLDRIKGDDCGPAPIAVAVCRVAGSGAAGGAKLVAESGQTADCDAIQSKAHTGSLVDRSWQLTGAPSGSTTKLTVGNQGLGVTMLIDAWGTYSLALQVRDEARTGFTTATIEAPPPDGVPIELHWTAFDRNDEANMFPHVELHVAEIGGAAGSDCGPATAKPWCTLRVVGTVQQALLHPEAGKTYRAYVEYQDFRLKGSPVACVRTFPKGAASIMACDEAQRNAGATWEIGAIDEATSTFYDPKKGKPAPITSADAGAPVSVDAGTRDAAPARKTP